MSYGYGGPGNTNSMGYRDPSGPPAQPPSVPSEPPKAAFRYGEQAVWSTQGIIGGAAVANQQFRLFATPQTQNGNGFATSLSIAETNQRVGGFLPQNEAFDVYGLALHVMHFTAASDDAVALNGTADERVSVVGVNGGIQDLVNVQNNGVLTWDFTKSSIDVAPIQMIGAGGGAFGAVSTTQNAKSTGHMNNGAGTYWLYNRYPVALPGTTTFAILLRFGSRAPAIGANAIACRCVMVGYYKTWFELG